MEHIFALWPTTAALAQELGQPYTTVASWKQRGSIPARFDMAIVSAAAKNGHRISLEDFAKARCEQNEKGAA